MTWLLAVFTGKIHKITSSACNTNKFPSAKSTSLISLQSSSSTITFIVLTAENAGILIREGAETFAA
uniref:Uncharacterized protein n=1 Tax=Ciona intestinalis TaxID=7719 RepID=H2XNM3_CIOIN